MNAMKSTSHRALRLATVGALSAAMLSSGALSAAAAAPAQRPRPRPRITISFNESPARVRRGGVVDFSGRTRGLRAGSRLTLEERMATGRWARLPERATVDRNGNFDLRMRFPTRGRDRLRMADDFGDVSPSRFEDVF